jgi:SAM-dependent methyltransferase
VPESGSEGDSDAALAPETQRRLVRERYGAIATSDDGEDCCSSAACCDPAAAPGGEGTRERGELLGYSTDDLDSVEAGANLGLGCGNPKALASLAPGESVLDLGSGAGFDCFLAAQEVGEAGRVVGVDMTPEMVEQARANAAANESENVEFRLGEIEHLPVADGTVDVVISNCVVNLSPDEAQVFREAFRALRAGGRLAISDVVLTAPVPDDVRADPDSVAACVAGASTIDRLEELLADAGFEDVEVTPKDDSDRFVREWDDDRDPSAFLVSAAITARKPHAERGEGA